MELRVRDPVFKEFHMVLGFVVIVAAECDEGEKGYEVCGTELQ